MPRKLSQNWVFILEWVFKMVYEYEVELKLTNPNTFEKKLVKRTERAYTPLDAMMQASINQAGELETGSAEIKIISVKPPSRLIDVALKALANYIESQLSRLYVDASSPGKTRT